MIVLTEESPRMEPSASLRDITALTHAARLTGFTVFHIPPNFDECGCAQDAIAHIPAQSELTLALWIGYIPDLERYSALYGALLDLRIQLVNTPREHRNAMEFDHMYNRIFRFTAVSRTVHSIEEARFAAEEIGYPVFVKGVVQSRKAQGLGACMATNERELNRVVEALLASPLRARGRIVVRQFLELRHLSTIGIEFPQSREYRVFLWRNSVLQYGYYWDTRDDLAGLSAAEESQVLSLARVAARKLGTPYVAIDIAQQTNGNWTVIETADAQFAGLSQVSALKLLTKLRERIAEQATKR